MLPPKNLPLGWRPGLAGDRQRTRSAFRVPDPSRLFATGEAARGDVVAHVRGDGTWEVFARGALSMDAGEMRAPAILDTGRRSGPIAATIAAAVALRGHRAGGAEARETDEDD